MKILVINSGSSSLKYQLINTQNGDVLCKGVFERIGDKDAFFEHTVGIGEMNVVQFETPDHGVAVKKMLELVADIMPLGELSAIGHRVVHGGEIFKSGALATPENLAEVDKLTPLAPLHNPANLTGVRACIAVLPTVPNVMVFDTAFHSTIPARAFMYALPIDDYNTHKIRRYGFHGTSHNFVARKAAEMRGIPIKDLKIITCHIGNGGSVCAIDGGKSVETSMGATPLEGLIMGTRSGDIDPAIIQTLCEKHKMTVAECVNYLNKKSGLLGLSAINNDMRDLMGKRHDNPAAQLAIDCFNHRLTKYIGAYTAIMNGVDIIVWTGGIGNNNEYVRAEVMKNLTYLGADINVALNNQLNGQSGWKNLTMDISAKGAKVKTYIINTNEELEIAMETQRVVGKK
jgi:acetate kinase